MSEWAWRFGMIILFGVPAIIGGGLVWHFVENWVGVIVYEVFLLFVLSWVLARGDKLKEEHH
ncbi:hypothetical protein [Thermodesulforhabdus norvegica]|uniref:Uncharacterized protein n=1 Tax=Thermodesulforhabdus norvegica TaxID=39841 RepID=A0A1I4UV40_9BACT|nr:hypothetical protein [Thermodesulforhabdus norvegica]SFM92821.1 hypothetical protein SAMN05660836_01980 [Thermodesulforhabdus norvegica]